MSNNDDSNSDEINSKKIQQDPNNKLLDSNQNPIQSSSKLINDWPKDFNLEESIDSACGSGQQQTSANSFDSSNSATSPSCMFDWSPHTDFDDYSKKLNLWIWECQQWCHFHANYQTIVAQAAIAANATSASAGFGLNQQANQLNNNANNNNSRSGTVYAIPKIWKRFLAELVDCVLLLVFKLTLTLFLSDYIHFGNLEEIDLRFLNNENLEEMFEFTYEIMVLAVIHRIIVCVYETCSLYRVSGPASGGATPGKALLGLKVVSCTSIEALPNNLVRISPAGNIGFLNCLLRALIKNLSIVFFIPACFTIIGSSYNRTAYDVLCNCVVVENPRTGAPPLQAMPPRANRVN